MQIGSNMANRKPSMDARRIETGCQWELELAEMDNPAIPELKQSKSTSVLEASPYM